MADPSKDGAIACVELDGRAWLQLGNFRIARCAPPVFDVLRLRDCLPRAFARRGDLDILIEDGRYQWMCLLMRRKEIRAILECPSA